MGFFIASCKLENTNKTNIKMTNKNTKLEEHESNEKRYGDTTYPRRLIMSRQPCGIRRQLANSQIKNRTAMQHI